MNDYMLWIGFNIFVLAMLALDLGVFHRLRRDVDPAISQGFRFILTGLDTSQISA